MYKPFMTAVIPAIAMLLLVSCNSEMKKEEQPAEEKASAFELTNIDSTFTPCDNFYQYAVGNWIKNNPVPSTESRWGMFNVLFEENNEKLRTILEEVMAGTDQAKGSVEQLVGDFYTSAMDSNRVEQLGLTPIRSELEEIEALESKSQLIDLLAKYQTVGGPGIFNFYVGQDSKNSEAYISFLSQSGLGLPDRDYYTEKDERSTTIREAYLVHLQKMFELLGDVTDQAVKNAKTVMDIESQLAVISMTRTERRDVEKTYNKMSIDELNRSGKNIDWPKFLTNMNVGSVKEIVVRQPDFMKKADLLIGTVSLDDWKTYLRWHIIDESAQYLSSAFVEQNFDFFGRTLSGQKEMKPRWKRSMSAVNGFLGEPLGQLFVKKHFPESSKQKVANMVENLREVYKERVRNLDWMSEETKKNAIEKLNAFNYKIGYPDKWRDYSSIDISKENFVQNLKNVSAYSYNYMINRLGKPIDKDEWFMTPQTVNAYYSSSKNEIVFPAGILQPPFYNKDADDAINYGGIGAVIGHEFTHGFDDQGSKFDAAGNLNNWWTDEDRSSFEEKANVVVEQFNQYEPLDSVFIQGKLTLGENLADLGGLTLSYYALEKSFEGKEKPADIDGFNYKQRFFLGWASVWKNSITDEELRRRIKTDPHSPGEYRVIGPVSNMKEFADAFGCQEGDMMLRGANVRATVW